MAAFSVPQPLKNSLRLTCAAFLAGEDRDFSTLKRLTGASDGNLSVQLRHLEEDGLVSAQKGFSGRQPRTVYRLTPLGRKMLTDYVTALQGLVAALQDQKEE